MSNPLDQIKEKFWINVYYSDNPKAPICNIEFVNKDDKNERYKHPVWKNKKKDGYGFVGNAEAPKVDSHNQAKANAYQPDDTIDDSIPF
jgi:hypothetical protein